MLGILYPNVCPFSWGAHTVEPEKVENKPQNLRKKANKLKPTSSIKKQIHLTLFVFFEMLFIEQ